MKATQPVRHLTTLSLFIWLGRTTTFATADDQPQLTLPDTRPWLTIHSEPEQDGALSFDPLEELQVGLDVMQSTWFEVWVGTWPSAIDWTAAVQNTHLVSSLSTLSRALNLSDSLEQDTSMVENDLNRYFSQNIAYYFGENAFSIRNQAYDDMFWVVLGWLESIRFIERHSQTHVRKSVGDNSNVKPWQGQQFIQAFSHRARIFYDLSSRGWDDELCGGGMVWSPYLGPYKNAITNQLYISASIGMYLYFTGDHNSAPFMFGGAAIPASPAVAPHDLRYLEAAVKGYDWLKNSGMQNAQGLYTDGFHIRNWRHGETKCNIRNNMVFTYNQGVILSGLRGLWEGTGNVTYLKDAHHLVRDVIKATGWNLRTNKPFQNRWSGLGRKGILEERCDAAGRCSQDGQTFKGIFFHHLTLLCEPLPRTALVPNRTHAADKVLAMLHRQSCREYAPWVAHNARAAVDTKDVDGKFGMWWGAGVLAAEHEVVLSEGAVDYRNNASELLNPVWLSDSSQDWLLGLGDQDRFEGGSRELSTDSNAESVMPRDPNWRGRGRTVETQGGGIAVLKALLELMKLG